MPRVDILKECKIEESAKITILRGLTDYPADVTTSFSKSIDIDLPDQWHIGLIVGPSGSGKTTIAKQLFTEAIEPQWGQKPIFDEIPKTASQTAELFSSVGLSSVPAWLRPRHLLSGGEGFRADVAQVIALSPGDTPSVIDEFTSVVDRQVAKAISVSVSKYARREKRQLVCVGCHYDVLDWLQPDWVLDMADNRYYRRSLQRRPPINLDFGVVSVSKAWPYFEKHHYMNGNIIGGAKGWCFYLNGSPIGFSSYAYLPHPKVKNMMMASRIVVLPDFQGLGIGREITALPAIELKNQGFRVRVRTAHPGAQKMLEHDNRWRFCAVNVSTKGGVSKLPRNKSQKQLCYREARSYELK
jgi:energy-coupling factor transporter ATP-binding protein EcfA2